MSYTQELNEFKNYGNNILEKIREYKVATQERFSQKSELADNLNRYIKNIEKAAQEVVEKASSSVKIGVMGEFSSGKTTLLGSLLGYAGALPQSQGASTGNVTYLCIEQEKGLKQTEFQFEVEYLDQDEATECLEFMLQEAQENFKEAQENSSDKIFFYELFAKLKTFNPQESRVWEDVVDWCKKVIQELANSTVNPKLKNLIKETKNFAQSYIWYGVNVHQISGSINIDRESVRFGLQLPSQQINTKMNFNSIPQTKEDLSKFLQATFWLIRKINVEVRVSENIWNFSSIQGANKLVLLDFPGVGHTQSGVRDKFLCLRETKNVQTMLILTNGNYAGNAKNLEIFDFLQKRNQAIEDFILVGVGRFDEMNLEEESVNEPIPVSQIPNLLKKAIDSVKDYTKEPNKRIILLSAFVALDVMKRGNPSVTVMSDAILNQLNNYPNSPQKFEELRKKWQQLSQRLQDSEPFVAGLLDQVAEDGGISQLRLLLEEHINTHGLKQLYDHARQEVENLRKQQMNLENKLNEPSLQEDLLAYENSKLYNLRTLINELINNYNALTTYLKTTPLELGVAIDAKRGGIPLTKEVNDEVIAEIYSWREWRYLIGNIENGKIKISVSSELQEAKNKLRQRFEEDLSTSRNDVFLSDPPIRSDDFYKPFEDTLSKLKQQTHEKINKAIEDFLKGLSNYQVSLEGDHNTIDLPHLRKQLQKCLPDSQEANKTPLLLLYSTDSTQWKNDISVTENISQELNPKDIFPLACEEAEKTTPGQKFNWHPDRTSSNNNQENHQVLVLQLRDAMITSVSQQLTELVREANKDVNEKLKKVVLGEIVEGLKNLLNNNEKLRTISYGESQAGSFAPDWLVSLKDMTSIQSPL